MPRLNMYGNADGLCAFVAACGSRLLADSHQFATYFIHCCTGVEGGSDSDCRSGQEGPAGPVACTCRKGTAACCHDEIIQINKGVQI